MNLNKLESKLDDALSKETTESLTNWLNNKKMEKKQLATEWLMEQLYENVEIIGGGNVLDALLDEAKEMEKENIIEAFYDGEENSHKYKSSPTLYFNETFKPE